VKQERLQHLPFASVTVCFILKTVASQLQKRGGSILDIDVCIDELLLLWLKLSHIIQFLQNMKGYSSVLEVSEAGACIPKCSDTQIICTTQIITTYNKAGCC
jgi:hypothetical protein